MENKLDYIVKFNEGAIPSEDIANAITEMSNYHNIGAHSIFIGQVRGDAINNTPVSEIEYTINHEMAMEQMESICQVILNQNQIQKIRIFHSTGKVAVGKICLVVLVGDKHRKKAQESCREIVEKIKNEVPIWGKEILINDTHQWKINT